MSRRTRRPVQPGAETTKPSPPPAALARVETQGSSPVPLVVLAFGVPLVLLIIGMFLMTHN